MDPFIGEIIQFGGSFAISGWATCDGQLLAIAQNAPLYSILGTTFGGDGRITFGLPDMRGRVSLHWGTGPGQPSYQWGQQGGAPSTTLISQNIPAIQLMISCFTATGSLQPPATNILAGAVKPNTGDAVNLYAAAGTNNATMAPIIFNGQSQPIDTTPAYICLTWLIALEGIFPPRN